VPLANAEGFLEILRELAAFREADCQEVVTACLGNSGPEGPPAAT